MKEVQRNMYVLKTSASFDSAHFLYGYNGKCSNIHGHHWIIEIEASQEELQISGEKRGMVIDFGDLKKILHKLADNYDHALIYEEGSLKESTVSALCDEGFRIIPVSFRPTAENFAKHFFSELNGQSVPVRKVTVYETPENCASYEV